MSGFDDSTGSSVSLESSSTFGVADLDDCDDAEFFRLSELELELELEVENFLDFLSDVSLERLLCLLLLLCEEDLSPLLCEEDLSPLLCEEDLSPLLCEEVLSPLLLLEPFFEDEEEEEVVVVVDDEEAELLLPVSSTELFGGCFCTCVEELLPLLLELEPPVVPTLVLPGTEADFCSTVRGSIGAAGTLRLLLSGCGCVADVDDFVLLDTSGGGGGAGCIAGGGAAVFGNGG